MKRLVDFCLALIFLAIALPFMLIIALVIFMQDGGSAIFSQERIGLGGKPFMLYKFRSMKMDAEANNQPQLFQENDSRLTKFGRFLRASHLDELPQFWNIIKGDMSIVGYRPEREYYIRQIMERNPDYALLYQIRPGLFSYATLYNGYTDTIEKMLVRLEMDLMYLQKISFCYDTKISILTISSILIGKKV
ncbi:sugar transferase [Porphyromonas gulae]|uniref:Sugar transferase n=1 Tax=Porphyromonas gulae TaxID=111105 RepID=A0A0A2GL18_9PORP|nr:sugar transferase [Porphyromonas sp. COT-052 OH4946]KGN68799.1 sugar transferase [Porphyromonas gulae]KGN72615.1 sugar transferase [Porphyromonas gulae]KGN76042.1 sugar transferase [Porphyromonas gulae]KGN85097.1 sugar transferase [Porphyromonas gulae]